VQQQVSCRSKTLDYIAEAVSKGDKVELREFWRVEVKIARRASAVIQCPRQRTCDSAALRGQIQTGKEMRAEVLKLTPKTKATARLDRRTDFRRI